MAVTYLFQDAENECVNEGSHLVSIESNSESSFVYALASEANVDSIWTGLNSRKVIIKLHSAISYYDILEAL